jgi:hypothetical protein
VPVYWPLLAPRRPPAPLSFRTLSNPPIAAAAQPAGLSSRCVDLPAQLFFRRRRPLFALRLPAGLLSFCPLSNRRGHRLSLPTPHRPVNPPPCSPFAAAGLCSPRVDPMASSLFALSPTATCRQPLLALRRPRSSAYFSFCPSRYPPGLPRPQKKSMGSSEIIPFPLPSESLPHRSHHPCSSPLQRMKNEKMTRRGRNEADECPLACSLDFRYPDGLPRSVFNRK